MAKILLAGNDHRGRRLGRLLVRRGRQQGQGCSIAVELCHYKYWAVTLYGGFEVIHFRIPVTPARRDLPLSAVRDDLDVAGAVYH